MNWAEVADTAKAIEVRVGLPPGMLHAIAKTENGMAQYSPRAFAYDKFDPFARRVEPGFYRQYIEGTHWQRTRWGNTPEVIAASYGLCQVMYTTAVWAHTRQLIDPQEWDTEPWTLFAPETNLLIGAVVFAYKARKYGSWAAGASAYNAGSPREMASGIYVNQSYVDKIRDGLGGGWPPFREATA